MSGEGTAWNWTRLAWLVARTKPTPKPPTNPSAPDTHVYGVPRHHPQGGHHGRRLGCLGATRALTAAAPLLPPHFPLRPDAWVSGLEGLSAGAAVDDAHLHRRIPMRAYRVVEGRGRARWWDAARRLHGGTPRRAAGLAGYGARSHLDCLGRGAAARRLGVVPAARELLRLRLRDVAGPGAAPGVRYGRADGGQVGHVGRVNVQGQVGVVQDQAAAGDSGARDGADWTPPRQQPIDVRRDPCVAGAPPPPPRVPAVRSAPMPPLRPPLLAPIL